MTDNTHNLLAHSMGMLLIMYALNRLDEVGVGFGWIVMLMIGTIISTISIRNTLKKY